MSVSEPVACGARFPTFPRNPGSRTVPGLAGSAGSAFWAIAVWRTTNSWMVVPPFVTAKVTVPAATEVVESLMAMSTSVTLTVVAWPAGAAVGAAVGALVAAGAAVGAAVVVGAGAAVGPLVPTLIAGAGAEVAVCGVAVAPATGVVAAGGDAAVAVGW